MEGGLRALYDELGRTGFKHSNLDDLIAGTKMEREQAKQLRKQIVSRLKQNYLISGELKELDNKIKLLIMNRISVEKALRFSRLVSRSAVSTDRAAVSPETASLYGPLFHLLQVEPRYLAQLSALPQMGLSDTKILVQAVVFSLFGDQFEKREEGLLLALFREALRFDMRQCTDMGSFSRGNTTVTKMLTQYSRRGPALAFLRANLGPFVLRVAALRDPIDVNPVVVHRELYEEHFGRLPEPQRPPLSLDADAALTYPHVAREVERRRAALVALSHELIDLVRQSVPSTPYGLRYLSRCIHVLALERWPDAPANKLLSLVGGYLFLRVITPAIVSPSEAGLVDEPIRHPVAVRNLVVVAGVLQKLANFSTFREPHMAPLNALVVDEKRDAVTAYFAAMMDVGPLEEELAVDAWELIHRGRNLDISIATTVAEITVITRHLRERLDLLAPDPADPLREHLEQLAKNPAARLPSDCPEAPVNIVVVTPEPEYLTSVLAGGQAGSAEATREIESRRAQAREGLVRLLAESAAASVPPAPGEGLLEFVQRAKNAFASGERYEEAARAKRLEVDLTSILAATSEPQTVAEATFLHRVAEEHAECAVLVEQLALEVEELAEVLAETEKKSRQLNGQLDTYRTYLEAVKDKTVRPSLTGTTLLATLSLSRLLKKGIAIEHQLPRPIAKSLHVDFTLSSAGDAIIGVKTYIKGKPPVAQDSVALDDLLDNKKRGVQRRRIADLVFHVDNLVVLLNSKLAK